MRNGLITQPDADATSVALTANRNTIDHLSDDVASIKVKHSAVTEASNPLPPAALVRMISEVR